MTLAAIIEQYEARRVRPTQPTPLHPGLTAQGVAVLTVYRLRRLLADLTEDERRAVLALAVSELEIIPGPAPLPAEKDSRYCFFCMTEFSPDLFDCPTCPAA